VDAARLEIVLAEYNPWWLPGDEWSQVLPDYERPIVGEILADLRDLPQMISVTGPRRVGKSTALRHVIRHLISKQAVDPGRIVYFSLDDPEVFTSEEAQRIVLDLLLDRMAMVGQITYVFLDEIQRLPRWELFLKKAYDLKRPFRFVISGSASSPIFRSSQESLLGRIKDRHLLPFSFREYCEYRLRHRPEFARTVAEHCQLKPALLEADGPAAVNCISALDAALEPFRREVDRAVLDYTREGGFPEVWDLPGPARKIEYLMEQQVRKVLFEDLMTVGRYRKPENVLRFFIYLLSHPGIELNTTKIASEAGVQKQVVDDNLPLLEKTDLILRIQKFSHQPLRVRQGNIKTYPIDMALRNAVLKTQAALDEKTMGLYAENMVVRELMSWPERIELAYFREKEREVDCVLTHGGNRYLPIEVKHRKEIDQIGGLKFFMKRYGLSFGCVVTRDQKVRWDGGILMLPLRYFLLAC
jgi:predicted AAA+ superfamily ATPase